MITLQGILENTIGSIIAELFLILLAFIISKFGTPLLYKESLSANGARFDVLKGSIFLTSVSVFNFILNMSFWNNQGLNILFSLTSIIFIIATVYIYKNQCPYCKRFLGAKIIIDTKIIKEFTRQYKYRTKRIWLYSNGNLWKSEYIGPEKTRNENWVTRQEFYECRYCHHKWDSGHFNVNLDEATRPKPEKIRTDKTDPAFGFT